MTPLKKIIDTSNLIVILLTFILFVLALFVKGITKEIIIEVSVLLVSIKLILFTYKQTLHNQEVNRQLEEIKNLINKTK